MGNMARYRNDGFCLLGTSDLSEFCGLWYLHTWFRRLHIRDEEAETCGNSLSVLGSVMHSSSGTSMSVSSTYHHLALNVPLAYGRQGLQGVKVCEFGYEQGTETVITESKLILLSA